MSKNAHKKISQRVAALREELERIPDPAREAERKRRWQGAVGAFANGDPKPPDDHAETLAMWQTLTEYYNVFLEAKREGLMIEGQGLTAPPPTSCPATHLYSGRQPLEVGPFHEVVGIDLYLPLPILTYSRFRISVSEKTSSRQLNY